MEVTGKVLQKFPIESGTSKNGKGWKKQHILIETLETYPKKIYLSFFGDKIDAISNVYVGAKVTVSINIESREYNGKYYTEVSGWKLEMEANQPAQSPQMDQANASADFISNLGADEQGDDLPF